MYKPGTQLIITEPWAAFAAHKLGFEVKRRKYLGVTMEGTQYSEPVFAFPAGQQRTDTKDIFQITVTESGPNDAERFLPQRNDLIETVNDTHFIVTELLPDDPTWVGNKNQSGIQNPFIECRSIIERNGIPFPQFSEVIEPEKENNNGL